MDKIIIEGGVPLNGSLPIGGGKNAALPLMVASLLTSEPLHLTNIPPLADIQSMLLLLKSLGVQGELSPDDTEKHGDLTGSHNITLHTPQITSTYAPYDIVRKMRASVLVLGPLLAREHNAIVSLPGGCAIGARPVDLHIEGLKALGAKIEIKAGYIEAEAKGGLIGADINLKSPSVGATENLLMAACLAKGETRILNAAMEPEIDELANCLVKMGAIISGIGSSCLVINGVEKLVGCTHRVEADRIEAGSYAMACAITGGNVLLQDAPYEKLNALWSVLTKAGIRVIEEKDGVRIDASNFLQQGQKIIGSDVMSEPFPGYPTDLQAQFMALMTVANGASMISETIFENRFMHVPELQRMGANINLHGGTALVRGVNELSAAEVMATDLRASMSLVIAALAAKGKTTIHRVYHLDRGYGRLVRKLQACGAKIERVK